MRSVPKLLRNLASYIGLFATEVYKLGFHPLYQKMRFYRSENKREEDLTKLLNGNPTLAASPTASGLSGCEWTD